MKKFASALLGLTLLFGAVSTAYSSDDHKDKDHKDDKKHDKKKGH